MLSKRIGLKTLPNILFKDINTCMASLQFRNMKERGFLK
jgi:hypothetical protein